MHLQIWKDSWVFSFTATALHPTGVKPTAHGAGVWLALFQFLSPNIALSEPLPHAFFLKHCTSGTLLRSLNADLSGYHLYREPPEGVQSSEASFEFWEDGHMEWSVSAFRACSNGVSTCAVVIPYKVNGILFDSLEVGLTSFSYNGETNFWVFSQLHAASTILWLKTYVFSEVSLASTVSDGYEPVDEEISLPDVFVEVVCP